jgi:2-hydroxychromene-2-carboxylate isomerase
MLRPAHVGLRTHLSFWEPSRMGLMDRASGLSSAARGNSDEQSERPPLPTALPKRYFVGSRNPEALLRAVLFADFTSLASWLTEHALRPWEESAVVKLERRALELLPPGRTMPTGDAAPAPELVRRAEGLGLRPAPRVRVRTRKDPEALRFARAHGDEGALAGALYAAYWEEGRDIGRIDVVVEVGERMGLDPFALKVALDIDRFAEEVEADRRGAVEAGVSRLPTLIVAGDPPRVAAGPLDETAVARLIGPVGPG